MGMSIDEIIRKENEIAAEFQKAVDTHIVNDNGDTIEEICCDDTEVIEEHLQRCKVFADYHNQIADTMRKYQKIEQIVDEYNLQLCDNTSDGAYNFQRIKEVVEDGTN